MIIAADTGVRITPALAGYLPDFIHGAMWGFAPLALVAGATVILLLREFVFAPRREKIGVPKTIPTNLRLQFQPNSIIPTCLEAKNVFRWYTICNILTPVQSPGARNKVRTKRSTRQWFIFLVFEQPTSVKQITIDGHGATLPICEVKDSGPRHAVVYINGDVGGALIDITCIV